MPYMLVRLQCAVGKTQQFNEVMSHFFPILEDKEWILRGAFATSIGRLNSAMTFGKCLMRII